ncbi:MAG: spermidine synthase [Planctomycetota bacterium]
MSSAFEELDYRATALGELILRRRRPVGEPDQWVYEVKLDGRFLMSSLVSDSERELATRALAALGGDGLRVLVGGLGLGWTANTVLADARVTALDVVELLPEVIAWHERGLVPLGAALCGDPRCRLVEGDCLRLLQRPPGTAPLGAGYDALLLDIDDAPDNLLDPAHAGFYTPDGLRAARAWLRPGGVFALWTNVAQSAEVLARLRAAFPSAEAIDVGFENPLLGEPEVNALYFARG